MLAAARAKSREGRASGRTELQHRRPQEGTIPASAAAGRHVARVEKKTGPIWPDNQAGGGAAYV